MALAFLFIASCQTTSGSGSYYGSANPQRIKISDDLMACKLESIQKVPSNNVISSSPTYSTPVTCNTGFGGFTRCTGGNTYGGIVSSYDINADLREQIRSECVADKGIIKMTNLPKCEEWSLGGWYDGRFNAEELAALRAAFTGDLRYNYIEKLHFPDNMFYRYCIWKESSDTFEGMTQTLANFPQNFITATQSERDNFVTVHKMLYKSRTNISTFMFKEFSDLVSSMQARIEFCTGQISEVELEKRYFPTDDVISSKDLKQDLCVNDVLDGR